MVTEAGRPYDIKPVHRIGKRDITTYLMPHLPSRFCCLKYATRQGECPERQRGRTVNPLA